MWNSKTGDDAASNGRHMREMFDGLSSAVKAISEKLARLERDIWGTSGVNGLLPALSESVNRLAIDQAKLANERSTLQAQRWHEVYMRVLSARIDANDSTDAHASALKVADAAYPPPPAAEEKP